MDLRTLPALALVALVAASGAALASPDDPDRPVSQDVVETRPMPAADDDGPTYDGDCGAEMCAFEIGDGEFRQEPSPEAPSYGDCGAEVCALAGAPDDGAGIEAKGQAAAPLVPLTLAGLLGLVAVVARRRA